MNCTWKNQQYYTHKFRYEGDVMIVSEYYRGRFQHEYIGYPKDNGASVDIFPIKGKRSFGDVPYVAKRLIAREMIREEPRALPRRSDEESEDDYDPTVWYRAGGEPMEGVQLSF